MNNNFMKSVREFCIANVVPILFLAISILGIYYSRVHLPVILSDVISRFGRNAFLVLSLLIPVLAGMGLNFGIVLGAMAGQAALFVITLNKIGGLWGMLVAFVISIPIAMLLGWLTAKLLNKTKGQEMITSLILGFFAMGIYQFIFLYFIGGILPLDAPGLMLSNGIGIRNTIDLAGVKYGLDNILKLNIFISAMLATVIWLCAELYSVFKNGGRVEKKHRKNFIFISVILAVSLVGQFTELLADYRRLLNIPIVTYSIIAALCFFIVFFFKTKLGQNMRAVGQSGDISEVSGINVNRIRTIATVLSIVLAAFGQIIFLQNMGNISTYNAHENVGMFSAAALLIGGATVAKATVSQAIIGTLLFHLLFNVSPMAGQNLFGSPEIGEYFRVFIAYGIIALTLALHAWKQVMAAKQATTAQELKDDKEE